MNAVASTPGVAAAPAQASARPGKLRRVGTMLAAVAIASAAFPARGAESAADAAGARAEAATRPVVELPKFEVVDSRLLPQPESWLYAEVPGFEILSQISKRETQRFVSDFVLLQDVVRAIMPALVQGHTPVPTALILCGARGRGFDQFVPADQSHERYGRNSFFFANPERTAIVIDFALTELQLDGDLRLESDPYRAFYAAYFRFLIRRQLGGNVPPWFEEGLVQLFAATEFDRKTITFAQIGDGFGAEKIGDFNRMLHQRHIMPFGEMLAATGPRARDAFWSAQCYAFVHYCLYGSGNKYQKPFVQFVQRVSEEEPREQLFRECFGRSYEQMATELRGYIEFTAYKKVEFRAKKGQELPKPQPVALRDATDAEVGRIKGEVLRLAGHGVEARNTLIAPYVRGERDPRLLAALGLDEKLSGQDARARKFLEAAAAQNVQRARAYLELARLRLDEAKAGPGAPDGRLDAGQVGAVLAPLFTARKLPPPLADVYALIAETWTLSARPPEAQDFAVVVEGLRLFPRDASLLMQATLLAAKRGFAAEARILAERGARLAKDPGEQDRFRMIAAAFERDADPKAAAPEEKPAVTDAYILREARP